MSGTISRGLRRTGPATRAVMRRLGRTFPSLSGGQTPSQAIAQWLLALQTPTPVRGRLLIVAFRNHTWVEWAAYCACVIRSMGFEATILFFGDQVDALYPPRSSDRAFWRAVSRIPGVELIDLNTLPLAAGDRDRWRAEAEEWSGVAVAYDEHIEEEDVALAADTFEARRRDIEERSVTAAAAVSRLLQDRSFRRAVCPSGLIGETRVMLSALLSAGLDTVCVEGWAWRPGHLIYNLNAPALEYNVKGWIQSFGLWTAERESEVDAYLRFLDGDKPTSSWLSNFHQIQPRAVASVTDAGLRRFMESGNPVFLMAPNVVGDSSTLRRETIFSSQQSWTRHVIEWFVERPHLSLIVRAHPAERWIGSKCRIYMADVARAASDGAPNVHIIGSEEAINTFSLLPNVRAGLVWMSSLGVDCVVRGVPAIVAAQPKYEGLGIVEEPATVEDYFASIERHGAEPQTPTRAQVLEGKKYLHMVFRGFSFEATGRNFRASGCTIGAMPNQEEHDRFYRILVGDEQMPDRPTHPT